MSSAQAVQRKGVFFDSLHLKNFTTFGDAHFEFVGRGINVFVGENGTGKTHAMKLLFSWMLCQSFKDARDLGFVKTLLRVMQADSEESLVRFDASDHRASIDLAYGERDWAEVLYGAGVPGGERGIHADLTRQGMERPVFIPAIEMLGHTKRFGDTYDTYELDFDWTVRDIVRLLNIRRRSPAPQFEQVIRQLEEDALHGKVEFDDLEERFYLVQGGNRQPMPLVAEGLRKIATLHTLLENGSINSGTTLFWDEPEVNLNPVLMDEVVRALLEIARTGVQVFLATHSYVLLEELRDAAHAGEVRYFGFERDGNSVTVNGSDDLALLRPNPILRQYESLYNRKMAKAFAERPSE